MANGITTPASPTTRSTTDWDAYQKKIQSAAASTRKTGTPPKSSLDAAQQATSKLTGTYGDVGRAAVAGYREQAAAQKSQAEKAASALEMTGKATESMVRNIEQIQSSVRQQAQKASESWNTSAEKADEYVKAARTRVGEVLTKLDEVNDEFGKDRSFAKAHAMQASVQATIGSMRNEEKGILENYGAESPEYQQFRASKRSALATVQSNIHASFQQMAEQQNQTYLNAVSEAYTKSNMYVGFQEQQHVEMLKYADEARTSYTLQSSQLEASLEQMKMGGMENMANWILETPSFMMDMTPLMTMLADLKSTQDTQAEVAKLTGAQTALTSAQAQKEQTWADYLSGKRKSVYGKGR